MTTLAYVHGGYLLVTGLWSLLHFESFQKVTGRKTDVWLVKTVAGLVIAIGAGLLVAAQTGRFDPALIVIAMGSAVTLLAIDVIYIFEDVISPVYGIDATIEAMLITWWTVRLFAA